MGWPGPAGMVSTGMFFPSTGTKAAGLESVGRTLRLPGIPEGGNPPASPVPVVASEGEPPGIVPPVARGGAPPANRAAGYPGSSSGIDSDRFSGPVPMGNVSTRAMPGLPGSVGKVSLERANPPAAAPAPTPRPRVPEDDKSDPAEGGGTGGAKPPRPDPVVGLGAMGVASPPAAGWGGVGLSATLVRSGNGVVLPGPPAGGGGAGGVKPPGPPLPRGVSPGFVRSGMAVALPGAGGAGGANPPAAGAGGTSVSASLAGSGGVVGVMAGAGGVEPLAGGGGNRPSANFAGSGGVPAAGVPPGGGSGARVSALFFSSSGGSPPGTGGGGADAVASPAGAGAGGGGPSIGLSPVPAAGGGGGRVELASPALDGLGGGGIRSAGLGVGGGEAFLSVPLAEASTTSPLGSVADGLAEAALVPPSVPSAALPSPPSAVATCSVGGLWPSSSSGET